VSSLQTGSLGCSRTQRKKVEGVHHFCTYEEEQLSGLTESFKGHKIKVRNLSLETVAGFRGQLNQVTAVWSSLHQQFPPFTYFAHRIFMRIYEAFNLVPNLWLCTLDFSVFIFTDEPYDANIKLVHLFNKFNIIYLNSTKNTELCSTFIYPQNIWCAFSSYFSLAQKVSGINTVHSLIGLMVAIILVFSFIIAFTACFE
jgi:hypothetical protein